MNLEPAPEKLQLVEEYRQDLAAIPEVVPVHGWQEEELAKRKDNLGNRAGSGLSWEEIRRRVESSHGR